MSTQPKIYGSSMKLEDYVSVGEAAEQLGWSYHKLLLWIKRDKLRVLSRELAIKGPGGWLVNKEVISLFKGESQ